MPSQRAERVGRQILQEISKIAESDLADPRLDLVTFTDVNMTPDLSIAHVYFSTMNGGADPQEAAAGLKKANGYIRRTLAHRLSLRHVPELRFTLDESSLLTDRIGRLINPDPAAIAETDRDDEE
jgi:ribosome-binding factor A